MKKAPILLLLSMVLFFSCDLNKESDVYTITFNANGAAGTPPDPIIIKKWDYAKLPDKGQLNNADKIFSGWNTQADGTGKHYSPYASEYTVKPNFNSDTTLYAQWELFSPVKNLKITFGDGIILNWDPVSEYSNLEDPSTMYMYDGRKFVAYIILRRASNAGTWTTTNFVPFGLSSKPSYRDTRFDLSAGGAFEYMVALGVLTVKNNGSDFDVVLGRHSNVSNSNIESASILGAGNFMPAPTMVSAAANSATSITLSWGHAVSLNSHPCLGFYVFFSTDGKNWSQESVFIPYGYYSYTKTVSPSTTYYLSVAAVYNDGHGYLAVPVTVTTPEPPLLVTGVTAAAYSSTCIDVSWNENTQATAYRIYYEKGTSTTKYAADTVAGTKFTHTGLTPNTEYRYSIKPINIDIESYQFSNTAVCKTPVSPVLPDPVFFILTNDSYVPLKAIKINGGENKLVSNLYKGASCQIPLSTGTYSAAVYDTQDRQNNFSIEIVGTDVRYIITDSNWPPAILTIKNNYAMAIASAYLKEKNASSWGNSLINGPITTNNSRILGSFNQGLYEVYTESTQYYRVTSGTAVNGITVTGGVIDGYRPVWYSMPYFTLAQDMALTIPANGWSIFKPE